MGKIKVTVTNPTGNKLVGNLPKTRIVIPKMATGDNKMSDTFEDTPALRSWLEANKKKYPSIKYEIESIETETTVTQETVTEDTFMTVEEFTGKVTNVEESGGGWWAVTVDGIEKAYKVRSCTSEEEAIQKAFEEYSKG